MDRGRTPVDASLEQLLEAGKQAFDAGDRRTAHELWRSAAVANPYDERVWLSLLQVLKRPDDREVCLENIISINPLNTDARRQLRRLKRERRLREEASTVTVERLPKPKRERTLLRAVMKGIGIGLLALVIGVGVSILVYGGILPITLP
jgi:hypothetical protein